MRKAADAAAIGAFVIGSVVLVIVGVLMWGSGSLFRETEKFVCYFDGSVQGLEVGAPVKARGVSIGRVVRIQLRYRQKADDIRIPVFIELDRKRLAGLGGPRWQRKDLEDLIAHGLRARLEAQSYVTGILFVNFGVFPQAPVVLSEIDPARGYPEIPTVPRQLTQLSESVSAIVGKLESLDFAAIVRSIGATASNLEQITGDKKLHEALGQLSAIASTYKKLGDDIDSQLQPTLVDMRGLLSDARKAFSGLDGAAGAASRLVAPEAPLTVRLNETLDEAARAARAVHDLAEYLQRNPNSLLIGKPK